MRRAAPVLLAGVWLAGPAAAQVTMNEGALGALPAEKPAPVRRAPVRRAPTRPTTPAAPPKAASVAPPAPAAPPVIPPTPPAILALPPAIAVPLPHPPPLAPVPVADDAPGTAERIADGVRVTFGADRADLNPATADALRQFARSVAGQERTSVSILAYAAGSADDPSAPRRLSLERALAARAVLMAEGIPSRRIYPRALGPGGSGEPNRVDVVTGAPTPPAQGSPPGGAG